MSLIEIEGYRPIFSNHIYLGDRYYRNIDGVKSLRKFILLERYNLNLDFVYYQLVGLIQDYLTSIHEFSKFDENNESVIELARVRKLREIEKATPSRFNLLASINPLDLTKHLNKKEQGFKRFREFAVNHLNYNSEDESFFSHLNVRIGIGSSLRDKIFRDDENVTYKNLCDILNYEETHHTFEGLESALSFDIDSDLLSTLDLIENLINLPNLSKLNMGGLSITNNSRRGRINYKSSIERIIGPFKTEPNLIKLIPDKTEELNNCLIRDYLKFLSNISYGEFIESN